MSYYSEHTEEYIQQTFSTDMSEKYALLEPFLHEGASILDVGFGGARDMMHFKSRGYDVSGIDIEPNFVKHALSLGLDATLSDVREYQTQRKYDAIWACASLLHLTQEELFPVIDKLLSFLKIDGVLFLSMKKGEGMKIDEKGRRMLYVNEKMFSSYNIVLSKDTYEEARDLTWLNLIIKP